MVGFGVLLVLSLQPQQVQAQTQATSRVDLAQDNASPPVPRCAHRGEVEGLDPQGDGFLAVRTGPDTDHEQIDELHNGDVVLLCDYRNGWHRVVYAGQDQEATTCRAEADRLRDRQPLAGQCRSGWVHGNWVRWISR